MLPNVLHFSFLVGIRLITIFTDVFTFFHIKFSPKQCSTSVSICKFCQTRCNDQNNNCCCNKQKLDIPFKSTFLSYFVVAYFTISFFLENFVLPYWYFLIILVSHVVNIPLIVFLSRKNNFEKMAAARQRNNSNAWNQTQNQEHHQHYQIMWAREQRDQAQEMSVPESFQHLHITPVLCTD